MHEKEACQRGERQKSMMEKPDSSDIQLVIRQFLGVFPLVQDVGRSIPTQISQGSKTFESYIKQIFLSNMFWDASELVLCMQLEFKEEKYNEKTEKEEED